MKALLHATLLGQGYSMPRGDQSPPASLLIVDDNEAIRESIRLLLEDAGYTILEASNGHDALTVLRESSQPLVVLLDDRMPDLSGEEVLRAVLRDRQLRRHHTFILLSAAPHLSRRFACNACCRHWRLKWFPSPSM